MGARPNGLARSCLICFVISSLLATVLSAVSSSQTHPTDGVLFENLQPKVERVGGGGRQTSGRHGSRTVVTSQWEALQNVQGEKEDGTDSIETEGGDGEENEEDKNLQEVTIEDNTGSVELVRLVRSLQSQLLESQRNQRETRSLLASLQDQQTLQAEDMTSVRGDLEILQARLEEVGDLLEEVQGSMHHTSRDMKELKSEQQNLNNRLEVMVQDTTNEREERDRTEQQMESLSEAERETEHLNEPSGGPRTDNRRDQQKNDLVMSLQQDVADLQVAAATDRRTVSRLQRLVLENSNHQRAPPASLLWPLEGGSGDSASGELPPDALSSAYEEKHNTVGHNLEALKQRLHARVDGLVERFEQYDADLVHLRDRYQNISGRVRVLESVVVPDLAGRVQHLEERHLPGSGHINTSAITGQLANLNTAVSRHDRRIRNMEINMDDFRSADANFRKETKLAMMSLNESMVSVGARLADSSSSAAQRMNNMAGLQAGMRTDIKRHHRRLLQVEVATLNASLNQCKKVNEDMVQDVRIDQLRREMRRLDGQVGDHTGQLSRHDHNAGVIYKEVQANNRMIGEVMAQSKTLFDLVPRTIGLEREVTNLLTQLPEDCSWPVRHSMNQSGSYLLRPSGWPLSMLAYCQVDTVTGAAPWLVIQRRLTGAESFDRTWSEYKAGFGRTEGELWLGNDRLHALTGQRRHRLRVDMWDLDGTFYQVIYDLFRVDDEEANYQLHVGGYSGNATDAMQYSNGMPFSTPDRDNDVSSTHCAKFYTAGWWYKHCHYSNLNGRYTVGVVWFNHDVDEWVQMARTEMMIQPVESYQSPPNTTSSSPVMGDR